MTDEINQDLLNTSYSALVDVDDMLSIKEVKDLLDVNRVLINSSLCNTADKRRVVAVYINALTYYLSNLEKEIANQ